MYLMLIGLSNVIIAVNFIASTRELNLPSIIGFLVGMLMMFIGSAIYTAKQKDQETKINLIVSLLCADDYEDVTKPNIYFCNDCEKTSLGTELKLEQSVLAHSTSPTKRCPHCGGYHLKKLTMKKT